MAVAIFSYPSILADLTCCYFGLETLIYNQSSSILFKIAVVIFCISFIYTTKIYHRKQRDLLILCENTKLNIRVSTRLKEKIGDYQPPWWYNRHFGTMIPFGYNPDITYEREIFTVEDACFAVDWFPKKPDALLDKTDEERIKICVFYPGLGLGSQNVRSSDIYIYIYVSIVYSI